MRLLPPEITVSPENPYEKDVIGNRKDFGDKLKNIILETEDNPVIAINSKWGEGKTTFIKMWKQDLENGKVPVIYFDAFANDYTSDAFVSLTRKIINFSNEILSGRKKVDDFKESAISVAKQLVPLVSKIGVRALTLNLIKDEDQEKFAEIVKEGSVGLTGDVIENYLREKLDSVSAEVESIESFKEELSGLSNEISSKLSGNEEGKPLVIIVDELDRCRPSFAIDLIEKIKHLFSVKNVIFILVINHRELEQSVKAVYGQGLDARQYLQKFITLEIKLPKGQIGDLESSSGYLEYAFFLANHYEIKTLEVVTGMRGIQLPEFIANIAKFFRLSLRDLEKVFVNIALLQSYSGSRFGKLIPIMVITTILKIKDPDFLYDLIFQEKNYATFERYLSEVCGIELPVIKDDKDNFLSTVDISSSLTSFRIALHFMKAELLTNFEFDQLPNDSFTKKVGKHIDGIGFNRGSREFMQSIYASLNIVSRTL